MQTKQQSFHFFWSGPFSQWAPSTFSIKDETGLGNTFNCCEQAMMFGKAITFGDEDTAIKIMQSTNPKEQKQLGRQVRDFDPDVWDNVCMDIVYYANYAKFTQNWMLLRKLYEVNAARFVEASPYDKIWGIGMAATDPDIEDPRKWKGENRLGNVLTELREDLKLGVICERIARADEILTARL